MNTIIWRGVSSTTIDGLLICDLPPITKPKMKVKETTIDGRDGSTFEELGYQPYDKNVVIGLRGSYDLDRVIKYFTGEGDIIFGNEPTKVYKAKIVEKIDYKSLLRFKTATIPFRVQPYKYKYNEAYKEVQTDTGTSFEVFNEGLEESKPMTVLHGSGTVGISVNGVHIFDYTFPDGESEVVIDSELQDAYLGDVLKNRNMNGEFPILVAGTNIIGWSGNVSSIEILPRSRWL